MNNPKSFHRKIAIIILAVFIPTLFPVNLLYASGGGPTAPEAVAFEPVDATDMVNLISGDFSYVLPLLNIPSPEGGYPLALSYHAGIAMDQEASWVGLGWNLNPGAINRSINGIPDDWHRSKVNQITYNAGGEMTTYSGSFSIGWKDGMYSVGLYGAYTENKSFGGTNSYSFNGGVMGNVSFLSGSVGSDGASLGISSPRIGNAGSFSLSYSRNFESGTGSIGLSFSALRDSKASDGSKQNSWKFGSIGISLNSKNGLAYGYSILGTSMMSNNYSINNLSVNSQSYSITIPIYSVSIGLGFHKVRYWSYQKHYTKYNGALYAGDIVNLVNSDPFPQHIAFDSYNSIYKLDGDNQLDGDNLSYISYDNYSVSGQGISGSFKPGIFEQGSLINNYKSKSTNNSIVHYKNGINNGFTKQISSSNNKIHFYFDNENSSYLRVSSGSWTLLDFYSGVPPENHSPANQNLLTSVNIDNQVFNGYNSTIKKKRTGSVIEVFTNQEIKSNSSLILQPNNYNRTSAPDEGIGAFRVTSMDGKMYHYSIPVYQKQKFTRTTDVDADFENKYLEMQEHDPYATHWLLTAITGPDYFDVNQNGKVDEGDYGYWVEFDYGKWSDGFRWSTPTKTAEEAKIYEWGIKELYYLDKIKTRTHTAIFVKSVRQDNMSFNYKVGNNENSLEWQPFVSRSFVKDKNGNWAIEGVYENHDFFVPNPDYTIAKGRYGQYIETTQHRTLKLDKILLFNNNNFSVSKNKGNQTSNYFGKVKFKEEFEVFYMTSQLLGTKQSEINPPSWSGEFYNNVYDINDFTVTDEQKAIETIRFNYATTNLLAKNSRNSQALQKGRLTLNDINFIGKNGQQLIPSYKFEYINNSNYNANLEDNWGYYKNSPQQWSLNKIITPTGANLNVIYEADDINSEAVAGYRGFNSGLQFKYYNHNGKLRILIQEENLTNNINFTHFFQVGNTKLDLWLAGRHEYYDWGCEARKVGIDINSPNVNIISVTQNSVILEHGNVSDYYNSNGGFGHFDNTVMGLKHHPGLIREDRLRGVHPVGNSGCIDNSPRFVLIYNLLGNRSITQAEKNGGGIRVKEINIEENNIVEKRTKYFYNVPGSGEKKTDPTYISSGITSFVPQRYFKEIKYRTELPSPTVMYEYVTAKNYSVNNILEIENQYHFEVLKPDTSINDNSLMINNILEINKEQSAVAFPSGQDYFAVYLSKYKIHDKTANIGRLIESKTINNSGHLISHIKNNYENITELSTGISEESFNTYKVVKDTENNSQNYRLGVTSKIKYPNLLKSSITIAEGNTSTTHYDKYDFLTGQVLETRMESSDGRVFKSRVVPAYTKYSGMGSKVDDINNANMLSQIAASYSYLLDNGVWKETGVGITTWNNNWTYQDHAGDLSTPSNAKEKIWRKHKTYVWNGATDSHGIFQDYNSSTDTDDGFNWQIGVGNQPTHWKQVSEITLYDHFSMPLEVKDINNNKGATKMDIFSEKIEATGNGAYNEIYYSGAENIYKYGYWLSPEVRMENASRSTQHVHTGKYSVAATNNSKLGVVMRNGHREGRYKLSVWVHKSNVNKARVKTAVNGSSSSPVVFNGETYSAGNWVLKTHYFTINNNNVEFFPYVCSSDNTTVYFDDLMIRPVTSSIMGYVYNEYDELTHIIGDNGLATRYEYDAAGRLIKTYVEIIDDPTNNVTGGFKLQSDNKYHYKNL